MFVLLAAIFRPWNEKLALLKDRQKANATFSTMGTVKTRQFGKRTVVFGGLDAGAVKQSLPIFSVLIIDQAS
jgi:hypothetical protein